MNASTASDDRRALLDVRGLAVEFAVGRHRPPLRAVDGVDLSVAPGETVGLVGESGSGKTTIGRAVLGLVPVSEGAIDFDGSDITRADHRRRRELSEDLQVVFQDPYSSLNPTRTIGQTLRESLWNDRQATGAQRTERVRAMLERVGLGADAEHRYPLQFSGGQRQRIAIARALMARPKLVICDEPVSALDLSVQAQVLNLLSELQAELRLGYLFVAHDLAVVRHLSQRIVVLYRGRVMEEGDAAEVFERPSHPYTRALVDAAPLPDPERQRERRATSLRRAGATAAVPGDACPFAARCPHAVDACRAARPALETTPEGTRVACIRWRDLCGQRAAA